MDTQSKRINRIGKIGWEKHMAAWQSSGLTQAAYCRSHDLNPRYFNAWKKKLFASTGNKPTNASVADFVPIEVIPERSEPIVLQLADGIRVEVPNQLSQVRIQQVFQTMAQLAC
jgi:hypothetical protein